MDNTANQSQRRNFLKLSLLAIPATVVAGQVLRSTALAQGGAAKPGGALEMIKTTDPMAVSLGYVTDASKVDVKKWPKRAPPAGSKQFCYNCQFYQTSGDPKSTKTAPCTIFQGKGVEGKGWCNTWTENPKVKG